LYAKRTVKRASSETLIALSPSTRPNNNKRQHLPTGLSVKVTQERTQQANRAIALQRLKAKLLSALESQRAAALAELRGDLVKAAWGQQIRNYVLHPYKLAKDTRTGHETADVAGVLDGDLGDFIDAFLRQQSRRAAEERLAAVS
jgi:peptide chain release factor 2